MDDRTHQGQDRTSRRAILAAAAGGVGAWIAGAVGRAAPVKAADGAVVEVGESHTGTKTTSFTVSTDSYSALWGNATGGGTAVGVRGDTAASNSNAAGLLGIGSKANGVRGVGQVGVRGEGTIRGLVASGPTGIAGFGGYGGFGPGVQGSSSDGPGIQGFAGSAGAAAVIGTHDTQGTGVIGFSHFLQDSEVVTPKPRTGVYGQARGDASSRGVWGGSDSGQGVRGEATIGIGVFGNASSASGYAFRGSGRVRFDKVSGVATIPAGATSVTVTPGVDVTSESFVLLTAKANIGSRSLYYTTDATNNRITIRLSSSRPSSTPVGWLLLR